jgi:hypothetical protein
MIPPFNDNGVLPPGIHPATLDEIESRFGGQSEIRGVQMQSIRWMVDLAIKAGAERVVLNGSFVTDIIEPNDVDCVLLFLPGKQQNREAIRELQRGLPFLDIFLTDEVEFTELVDKFYATDRLNEPKGMVEVIQ